MGEAVSGAEQAAEVDRASEAPARRDRGDRVGALRRVEQIPPAALQPPRADPSGDRLALFLEQLVQQAQGDVMGGGDRRG